MVSRIILLFTLGLMASMTLPATATPHSQVKPREFNSDNITPASSSILVLNTTGASILSAIVDSGAGYAYFGTSATPAQVFKVRLSDFTNVANLTLGGSANAALAASAAILDPIHEIAYFGTLNGQIVKVDLSTFTNVTVVHPGLGGITAATIDPAAGFGYFGTSTGNILKMRLSDLTLNRTLTPTPSNTTIILPPSHSIDSAVIDTASGYAYFGDSGCSLNIFCTPSPNVVVKVRLSGFSIVSELDAAEDSLTSAGIDTSGGYIYFGGANLAGSQIVTHRPFQETSLSPCACRRRQQLRSRSFTRNWLRRCRRIARAIPTLRLQPDRRRVSPKQYLQHKTRRTRPCHRLQLLRRVNIPVSTWSTRHYTQNTTVHASFKRFQFGSQPVPCQLPRRRSRSSIYHRQKQQLHRNNQLLHPHLVRLRSPAHSPSASDDSHVRN